MVSCCNNSSDVAMFMRNKGYIIACGLFVTIKSFTGLAPQVTGADHLAQQRAWAVLIVARFRLHD
ncbi:hypothetical protein SY88_17665, partial [Clostridiales bacterium PH28_bin88]